MITMPAGRYYVGDLCYVMHDVWDEVCDLMYHSKEEYGKFMLEDGRVFVVWPTLYGDGTYRDNHRFEYGVDAGIIGCIKEEDIRDPEGSITGGRVHEFDEEFDTWEENGDICFGDVVIHTSDDSDESSDDSDEDWDSENTD